MNTLEEWTKLAAAELGLSPADVDQKAVLDVARDVAHNVVRPGAPVTAYLMGLAVGRGADPAVVAVRLSELAVKWSGEHSEQAEIGGDVRRGGGRPAVPDRRE